MSIFKRIKSFFGGLFKKKSKSKDNIDSGKVEGKEGMAYGLQIEGRNFNVVQNGDPTYGISINGQKTNIAPKSLIQTGDQNSAEYVLLSGDFRANNSSDRGRSISLSSFSGYTLFRVGYRVGDPSYGMIIDGHKVGAENLIANIQSMSSSSYDSGVYSERRDHRSNYSMGTPDHQVNTYNMQYDNWKRQKDEYDRIMGMPKRPSYIPNPGPQPIYTGPTGRVNIESWTVEVFLTYTSRLNLSGIYVRKEDLLNYLNSLKDSAKPNNAGWVRGSDLSIDFEDSLNKQTFTKYVDVRYIGGRYSVSGVQTDTATNHWHSKSDLVNSKIKSVTAYRINLF